MTKTVGNSVDAFTIACRKSVLQGAIELVDYVARVQSSKGVSAQDAFEIVITNVAYIYGIPVHLGPANTSGFAKTHPNEHAAFLMVKKDLNIA